MRAVTTTAADRHSSQRSTLSPSSSPCRSRKDTPLATLPPTSFLSPLSPHLTPHSLPTRALRRRATSAYRPSRLKPVSLSTLGEQLGEATLQKKKPGGRNIASKTHRGGGVSLAGKCRANRCPRAGRGGLISSGGAGGGVMRCFRGVSSVCRTQIQTLRRRRGRDLLESDMVSSHWTSP